MTVAGLCQCSTYRDPNFSLLTTNRNASGGFPSKCLTLRTTNARMNRSNAYFVCITKMLERHINPNIESCAETGHMWEPYLVGAARLGHMNCVRYLVEQCNANINEVGLVSTNHIYESGVSPLWAATIGEHLNIVTYLVSKGANVNGLTDSSSTPLSLACSRGSLDIVKVLVQNGANIEVTDYHGSTCLMLASSNGHVKVVKYLLSVGANLEKRGIDGKTALHKGVHSGCLEVVKVLLDHNAEMDADSCGETPILTASCLGHEHIVQHLIARGDLISKEDEINALELLGSTFAEKNQDTAFKYWKLAMQERSIHNIVIDQNEYQTPFNQYFKEISTPLQLEKLQGNTSAIDTHSLLVKMRVLGLVHPATIDAIKGKGEEFAANGQLKECFVLWMYTLETHQRILDVLNPKRFFFLMSLTNLFLDKVFTQPLLSNILLYFEESMNLFENCTQEIIVGISRTQRIPGVKKTLDFYYLDWIIPVAMHLMLLLTKLKPILLPVQIHRVKDAVRKLVKLNPIDSKGVSLMHFSLFTSVFCRPEGATVFTFPSLEVLNLLLEAGANPCPRDIFGNTPLHTLGKHRKVPGDMLEALLKAGAHLDMKNAQGHSFESLRASRGQKLRQLVNPVRHTSLQCLAAASIRRHGIPYKGVLDKQLERFVDFH
ncbi:protein fem-1 homolog C-like [Palaemon carinicauda]|uniref:protein fem-1 homolog C-like n=1 Tax=Palaemon carinicauda TaxID=392227 RepID=UPI0035B5971A